MDPHPGGQAPALFADRHHVLHPPPQGDLFGKALVLTSGVCRQAKLAHDAVTVRGFVDV